MRRKSTDGELESIEWIDHSNASAFEEFCSSFEQLLISWGLGEAGPFQNESSKTDAGTGEAEMDGEDWGFRSSELEMGKDIYSLMLMSKDGAGVQDRVAGLGELGSQLSFTELAMVCNNTSLLCDAEMPSFVGLDIARWFGTEEYLLLGPVGRAANHNDVSLLLSASTMAFADCHPSLPCFIPAVSRGSGDGNSSSRVRANLRRGKKVLTRVLRGQDSDMIENALFGTCAPTGENPGTTIHFDVVTEPKVNVPEKFHNLSGLVHLFKCKLWPLQNGSAFVDQDSPALENNLASRRRASTTESTCTSEDGPLRDLKSGDVLISVQYIYSRRAIEGDALLAQCTEDAYIAAAKWTDWHDHDDPSWRLHLNQDMVRSRCIDALGGGDYKPPLWGPLRDPIQTIDLHVSWPSFLEATYAENSMFSSLVPESAPCWMIRICPMDVDGIETVINDDREIFGDGEEERDPENPGVCPLATSVRCLFKMLQAAQTDMYKNQVLINIIEQDSEAGARARANDYDSRQIRDLLNELFFTPLDEVAVSEEVTLELNKLKRQYMDCTLSAEEFNAAKKEVFRFAHEDSKQRPTPSDQKREENQRELKFNMLRQPCENCWLCSQATHSKLPVPKYTERQLNAKTVPMGSILSILSLRIAPQFGASMEAFSLLWRSFVGELRWHWDRSIQIPMNQSHDDPIESVNFNTCVLHQKLALLNLCIASKAHKTFKHESFGHSNVNPGNAATRAKEQDDDVFFDANTEDDSRTPSPASVNLLSDARNDSAEPFRSQTPPLRLSTGSQVNVPWVRDNSLMTQDMISAKAELLRSLAVKHDTAAVHDRMLSEAHKSEIQAFKAVNNGASFEDFARWKGRSQTMGTYWDKLWKESEPMLFKDQLAGVPNLFNDISEGEKILHYFETLTPKDVLTQLLGIGLDSAEFVLSCAVDSFAPFPEIHNIFRKQLVNIRSQIESLNLNEDKGQSQNERSIQRTKQRSILEAISHSEYLISIAMSLLHKFPASIVACMLTEESVSGHFSATLDESMSTERRHVRGLLFPEMSHESSSVPEPDVKEYVLRCLARRPSFTQPRVVRDLSGVDEEESSEVRLGANRMYACIGESQFVLATGLTETSF
uniref:Rab3 GTPase-activating protein catalytic subunit n=1 Tax=Mucochytrium quahogii TaxID=96639 RepID=A0A7S2S7W5_9STRA|mmetsp:Transcript_14197/g.25224  ORF Transcript_14197/g.25224 Transcript_14197/m.25224 type:complete len:1115 (+) Transcript_14197:197-3541(+)|eukprot:CAMPEP_0203762200 /NCGR_PEP_ID=MMETSP0098-20131031/15140_1 /ASSEMBLY_ACC=CAM_ASM_000208 /TAXON_ID=96639 /ORGANISM=" , Strain NY0313808BC1" /LENGTH=1114 /DNA_ID=CAMNT_0050656523 /DNA_START=143 /DNA_END=3487 /DNA_ORIENTATION=+